LVLQDVPDDLGAYRLANGYFKIIWLSDAKLITELLLCSIVKHHFNTGLLFSFFESARQGMFQLFGAYSLVICVACLYFDTLFCCFAMM
jgi:hypothetical protein